MSTESILLLIAGLLAVIAVRPAANPARRG